MKPSFESWIERFRLPRKALRDFAERTIDPINKIALID